MNNPNQTPVDWWTGLHFVAGIAMGLFKLKPVSVVIIVASYEIIEQGIVANMNLKTPPGSIQSEFVGRETPANIAGDVLAAFAGYGLVRVIASH